MRCLFTLLVLMMLTVVSLSAQIKYQPPIDTGSLGFQIPERTMEELQAHCPVIMIGYSPSAGIPTRSTRFFYDSSHTFIKEQPLLDFVDANPCQTSQIYRQLLQPIDRFDRKTKLIPVGWIRADLDSAGRVIRLWGQDALGRYWVWRESQPFPATVAPAISVDRQKIE